MENGRRIESVNLRSSQQFFLFMKHQQKISYQLDLFLAQTGNDIRYSARCTDVNRTSERKVSK